MTTPEKFNEYVGYCLAHPNIRGRSTIVNLVAIGAAESGLNNMALGDNAKNNTPKNNFIKVNGTNLIDPRTGEGIDTHYSVGLGWLQHDSGWLRADEIINKVEWTVEAIRTDPLFSLDLLITRPGFIRFQGINNTYINFDKWMVYPKMSDQFIDDAEAAYDRILAL